MNIVKQAIDEGMVYTHRHSHDDEASEDDLDLVK